MTTLKKMCKQAGFNSVNEFIYISGLSRPWVHKLFKSNEEKFIELFEEVSNHKANRVRKAVIYGMEEAIKEYKDA